MKQTCGEKLPSAKIIIKELSQLVLQTLSATSSAKRAEMSLMTFPRHASLEQHSTTPEFPFEGFPCLLSRLHLALEHQIAKLCLVENDEKTGKNCQDTSSRMDSPKLLIVSCISCGKKVITRNRRHWKSWDFDWKFCQTLWRLVTCTPENVPPRSGDNPARPAQQHFRRSSIQVLSSRPRVCSCNFTSCRKNHHKNVTFAYFCPKKKSAKS